MGGQNKGRSDDPCWAPSPTRGGRAPGDTLITTTFRPRRVGHALGLVMSHVRVSMKKQFCPTSPGILPEPPRAFGGPPPQGGISNGDRSGHVRTPPYAVVQHTGIAGNPGRTRAMSAPLPSMPWFSTPVSPGNPARNRPDRAMAALPPEPSLSTPAPQPWQPPTGSGNPWGRGNPGVDSAHG